MIYLIILRAKPAADARCSGQQAARGSACYYELIFHLKQRIYFGCGEGFNWLK